MPMNDLMAQVGYLFLRWGLLETEVKRLRGDLSWMDTLPGVPEARRIRNLIAHGIVAASAMGDRMSYRLSCRAQDGSTKQISLGELEAAIEALERARIALARDASASFMAVHLVQCDERGEPVERLPQLPPALLKNCAASAQLFETIGYAPPWVSYITVHNGQAVGGCAFIGAPKNWEVEIAYFTLEEHEGHGYAAAATARLVEIAQRTEPHVTLIAKTLPQDNPSTSILKRNGFVFVGETSDHDIGLAWAWALEP